jgi:hypothetical protein
LTAPHDTECGFAGPLKAALMSFRKLNHPPLAEMNEWPLSGDSSLGECPDRRRELPVRIAEG